MFEYVLLMAANTISLLTLWSSLGTSTWEMYLVICEISFLIPPEYLYSYKMQKCSLKEF